MKLWVLNILDFLAAEITFARSGTQAAKVSINQNITGLLGNIDTNLVCSFVQEKENNILNVEIIAKNLTEDFDDEKKPIAIFKPDTEAKLHPSGKYLNGRVTLINITHTSTKATMTFHTLKCLDEKDYMCKYSYTDMNGAIFIVKSEATRILVKVPVREVHINKQPSHKTYYRNINNITLTCKAIGNPKPNYTWFKEDNNKTIISKNNLYVIEDVIRNNSGVYTCKAYNNINDVYYTHSNSVEIDIVDEPLPKSASSKISAVYVACTVPLILAVGFIVICLAVRKRPSNRSEIQKHKRNRCQDMFDNLMSGHSLIKQPHYTSVVGKSNTDAEEEKPGDNSNGILENNINCINNEVNPEETVDISQNKPTSSNIYAVPSDTLPAGIVKDRGKYEDHGVSDQDAVYSEVLNQANMKSGMSKARTSISPDNVDHNGDVASADQCHV